MKVKDLVDILHSFNPEAELVVRDQFDNSETTGVFFYAEHNLEGAARRESDNVLLEVDFAC